MNKIINWIFAVVVTIILVTVAFSQYLIPRLEIDWNSFNLGVLTPLTVVTLIIFFNALFSIIDSLAPVKSHKSIKQPPVISGIPDTCSSGGGSLSTTWEDSHVVTYPQPSTYQPLATKCTDTSEDLAKLYDTLKKSADQVGTVEDVEKRTEAAFGKPKVADDVTKIWEIARYRSGNIKQVKVAEANVEKIMVLQPAGITMQLVDVVTIQTSISDFQMLALDKALNSEWPEPKTVTINLEPKEESYVPPVGAMHKIRKPKKSKKKDKKGKKK